MSTKATQQHAADGYVAWTDLATGPKSLHTSVLYRLAGAITLVLLFAIAANSMLNYFSFQKSYQQTIRMTFAAIAEELGFKIESGVNLGMPLSAMNNIPALLADTAQYHASVRFLVVESPQGDILFSAGSAVPNQLLNNGMAAFEYDNETNLWFANTTETTVIGYDLVNSYQQLAGRLLLGYDQSQANSIQHKVKWTLVKESALVLVIFGLVTMVSLYLILYRFRQHLFALEQALRNIVDRPPPTSRLCQQVKNIRQSFLFPGKKGKQ